jgi:hypothetical protein
VKRYKFYVRLTHASEITTEEVIARDSWDAINRLPVCVYWDFARLENGEYSEEVRT